MVNEIPPLLNILNNRYNVTAAPAVGERGVNGVNGVNGTEFTPTIDYTGANLFAGNLVGVNTNVGVGQYYGGSYSGGYQQGGMTIAFA
mgnify:CR=1 FL=1